MNRILRPEKRKRDVLAITGILILSFAVRIINITKVYYLGTYTTPNIDGMYHLRIVELFYHGFIHSPLKDSYLAFPIGGAIYWPLGFDFFLAGLGWPVFLFTGSMHLTAEFLAWWIPIIGALSPVVIYFILLRLSRHRVTAVAGALFAALNWQLARVGLLATIDHHVAGTLLFALFTLLVVKQSLGGDSPNTDRILGILTGLALWFYTAAITLALMLGAIYVIQEFVGNNETLTPRWQRTFKWAFLTALIVVIGYGSIWTKPFSTVYLSGFHLCVFGAGWLAPVLLTWLKQHNIGNRQGVFILVLSGIFGIILVFLFSPDAAGIFLKQDPNAMVVRESQSLLAFYKPFQFLFMPTLLFAPVLLFFFVSQAGKIHKNRNSTWVALIVLFFSTAIMGISQIRFLHYTAVIILVGIPLMAETMGGWMMGRWKRFGRPLFHVAIALIFAVQLAVCWGMATGYKKLKHEPDTIRLAKIMYWIRQNTPETSGYFNPVAKPEYGILIPQWHYSHHLLFLAHRPEIGTPVGGTSPFIERIDNCLTAMAAETEKELAETCKSTQARYILVQSLGESSLASYMEAAARQLKPFDHPLPMQWNQSFLFQLTNHAAEIQPKLKYFHLVYEEPEIQGIADKNRWRLYELRVPQSR
ncbi:MAG: hypothetical protein GXO70_02460 [Acidobacteria bacterium]|nr:hypothetical protein [Acidobacteriota bacterium]